MPLTLQPVTLRGTHATLVPLSPDHVHTLSDAARDGELWRLWYTSVPAPEDMAREIDRRLSLFSVGSMLPFTVLDSTGTPVGMTTFMNVDPLNHRVEVGSTWYAARVQRTALNTECKLLLLTHAFDDLQCIAVELRTHILNAQSRRAIERIGRSRTGFSATTCACRTARSATPWSTASSRASGPPCGRTFGGSWKKPDRASRTARPSCG
jgi:RimJ/RimL family protein N-acetyltransferase